MKKTSTKRAKPDGAPTGVVARFLALSDVQKEAVYRSLDRDIPESETQPTTDADKARWQRVVERAKARGRGRPKVGDGAERINVTVERSLLKRADGFAKRHKMTRAELIARGLVLAMK